MKLDILYFGLIAEHISLSNEEITIESPISIDQLKHKLIEKYPILNKLEYQIAHNKEITPKNTLITKDSEIAILPPFAGG